ncbi:MAG: hypothetical protein RL277_2649 [Planctomycetota bacterium]|jgi:hypothetical protein
MEPTPRLHDRSGAPEVTSIVVYLVVFGLILYIALR